MTTDEFTFIILTLILAAACVDGAWLFLAWRNYINSHEHDDEEPV